MVTFYTWRGKILTVGGKFAISEKCCCTETPTEEPPTEEPPVETESPPEEGGCVPAPYAPDDPCYQQVIALDTYCCQTAWDATCQNAYDQCNNNAG
jgi:hypothetical protein